MQKDGQAIEQTAAEEHDMEKGQIFAQQGNSSPSDGGKDDLPCNQTGEGPAGLLCLVRNFPHLLVGPAVLFCLIVALGVFGIVYDTQASYDAEQEAAREEALSAADGLATQMIYELRAALSLAAVVKMNPNWDFLESYFPVLAEELFRQSEGSMTSRVNTELTLKELELLPFGRVRASAGKPRARNSTADIFSQELMDVFVPRKAMAEDGLHVKGPVPLTKSNKQAFTGG
ncbi:hypothetical protein DUNSADRAFT_1701 [Dunaliella salina]|uniref:Uncharacterized protein n=1 Tax=Dunaliella salina TaxID=3046 RepID=A0ABQ7FX70_DUNSA|nr:hypothetical protein DUNSADRAFT_1701 [Dunaliella salina]|eukprot:KAF5826951.1 hypothetical protein DUNSADRAFT_1701 [Dunaliella salina]